MVSKYEAAMIEIGEAALCDGYTIEVARNAWGEDNGQGVYVFTEEGDIVEELHVDPRSEMYVPVDFKSAMEWCEAHPRLSI